MFNIINVNRQRYEIFIEPPTKPSNLLSHRFIMIMTCNIF